jgi:hypothetical protein
MMLMGSFIPEFALAICSAEEKGLKKVSRNAGRQAEAGLAKLKRYNQGSGRAAEDPVPRLREDPKGATACWEASGVKVDQNNPDLIIEISNSENSLHQYVPKSRIKVSYSVTCNPF